MLKAISYCHLALENIRACIQALDLKNPDQEFIEITFNEVLERLTFVADELQNQ